MADPIRAFYNSMQAVSGAVRSAGSRNDARDKQALEMDILRSEQANTEDARLRAKQKREAAAGLVRANTGMFTAKDVATVAPEAGVRLGDWSSVFDDQAQRGATQQLFTVMDKAAQKQPLSPEEAQLTQASVGAMSAVGVMPATVPEIREQSSAAENLKARIVQIGEVAGPQLLGKQTMIDEASDPELFATFSKVFPSTTSGSKAYKDGRGRPVQFFVDGTGAKTVQDVRVYTVLEGVDPKTGEAYRAPMTKRRTSDPDDEVSGRTLGELYARSDFAQRASNAFLASIAGLDDGEAQKAIDHYREISNQVVEKKRQIDQVNKLIENPTVAALMQKAQGDKLQVALQGVQVGTVDASQFTSLLAAQAEDEYKRGEDEQGAQAAVATMIQLGKTLGGRVATMATKLEGDLADGTYKSAKAAVDANKWLFEIGKDLDKQSMELASKERLAGMKGKSGGSSAGGFKVDNDAYKLFDDQLNKQFMAEFQASLPAEQNEMADLMESDALGNQSVSMERLVAKMPEEMRLRYNAARQAGEHFMGDGSLSPILAANKAYRFANQPTPAPDTEGGGSVFARLPGGEGAEASAGKVMKALSGIPDVPARLDEVKRFLASDAPAEVKEKVRYQFEAEMAQTQASEGRKARQGRYAQGMATRTTPETVRSQIFTNLSQKVPDYSGYDIPAVGGALRGLDQIADFFFIEPTQAVGSGIAGLLRDFQRWAQAGGFKSKEQAVEAYAKENPKAAQQIAAAAQPQTQTGGMKP